VLAAAAGNARAAGGWRRRTAGAALSRLLPIQLPPFDALAINSSSSSELLCPADSRRRRLQLRLDCIFDDI